MAVGFWNEENTERLKTLWSQGITASDIAEQLGAESRNAIIGKAHRLGLDGRPKTAGTAPIIRKPKEFTTMPKKTNVVKKMPGNTARVLVHEVDPDLADRMLAHGDEAIPVTQRKTLLELDGSSCRWPLGDPSQPDFYFCGGPKARGSYCAYHAAAATSWPPKRSATPPQPERTATNGQGKRS